MLGFYILFLLCFGSLNTLTTKWQFTMESVGIDGVPKNFQKPWWGNFIMFVAMVLVLVFYLVRKAMQKNKQTTVDMAAPLLAGTNAPAKTFWDDFSAVALPSVLDLVSSGLNFMGLLYISASVWQMLRGSMIVFSAFLSILFLRRRLFLYHWVGIGICVAGIAMVGAASVLGTSADTDSASSSSSGSAGIGVALVLVAQVLQASQIVAEERLLKDICLPGEVIVGYEGLWGCLIMGLVVFPIMAMIPGSDAGSQENTLDTLAMINNSTNIQIMLLVYLCSCSTYNVARMLITNHLSGVHYTMIDASRTAIIWVLDLYLRYGTEEYTKFGEDWTPYSWLQAVGFVTLIYGQGVYGKLLLLPVPSLYRDEEPAPIEEEGAFHKQFISPCSSRHLSSPLPPLSPTA